MTSSAKFNDPLLDIAPILAVIVGVDERIVYANKMARREFDVSSKKVIGKRFPRLFPQVERKRIAEFISTGFILSQRSPHEIFQGYSKDHRKQLRFFDMTGVAFKRRNKKYMIIIINNVSKMISQIAQEEKKMSTAGQKQRELFLSVASHELKNPVASIQAYVKLLDKKSHSFPYARKYLSKIDDGAKYLTKLINDLLDISKIETGQLSVNKSYFDFNEMISELISDTEAAYPSHKIIIKGRIKENIFGDRDKIRQVVTNLILNAIKYSPKADKVIITIKKRKDSFLFGVEDFGVGIAKAELGNIFRSFYKVTSRKLSGGLGLGLFISSAIVKEHGGKIWAESELGRGSNFYFTIPLK